VPVEPHHAPKDALFDTRERSEGSGHLIVKMKTSNSSSAALTGASDLDLIERIATGDKAAFEGVMRKYNEKLFRIARAILKDDSDAEDVLQDAYLDAYRHLKEFRGGSMLGTWLTRIVINHALMRLRKEKRRSSIVPFHTAAATDTESPEAQVADNRSESPSAGAIRAETRLILERRIDELPAAFRTVFVMREVEDMSVDEVAECLSISPATVRTRLFRARALLREALARDIDVATGDVFSFAGARCDRIVAGVLAAVAAESSTSA
jgi:RNA polymerase sigma factor (sigma-70 family)